MGRMSVKESLKAFYGISEAISRTANIEKSLPGILEMIEGLGPLRLEKKGALFTIDKKRIMLAASTGLGAEFMAAHEDISAECACLSAIRTGDVTVSGAPGAGGEPLHGEIIVPLKGPGEAVGTLCLFGKGGSRVDEDALVALRAVGVQLGAAIYRTRVSENTAAISLHDPLTGLANRDYMFIELERNISRARRYGHPLSALMLDIDNFRKYNGTHGKKAGDRLLAMIARGLLDGTRDADLVVRYGGEEFFIFLPETGATEALVVAERIRAWIEGNAGVTVSIGVTSYSREMRKNGLIDTADEALYLAKKNGRNRVEALLYEAR